jgi:hypothetical protein
MGLLSEFDTENAAMIVLLHATTRECVRKGTKDLRHEAVKQL